MSLLQQGTPAMRRTKTKDMVLFALFTALIATGAFIRIPVPVCPFTLQLLFTTLAGLLLGSNRGAAAVAVYVALGLLGVPVFTAGGGPSYIFQPTFGYLIGFIVGAWLTGRIVELSPHAKLRHLWLANFAGLAVVYTFGMIYVYIINMWYLHTPIGIWPLFVYCLFLAVPGDICLCLLAGLIAKKLRAAQVI
jgi:biotin transport system substrate-specific component